MGVLCLGGLALAWPAAALDPPAPVVTATETPSPGAALGREGDAMLKERRYVDALAVYRRLLEVEPNSFTANQRAGWICNEERDYAAAEKYLAKAVELRPDSATTWAELGLARERQQQADAALEAYGKALALRPGDANALFGEGDVYSELKHDYPHAAVAYAQGLKSSPADANANFHLGWCLNESKKFKEALPHLKRATELSPGLAVAFAELSYACYETHDWKRSAQASRKAIHLDENNALARYVLGLCLARDGKVSEARSQASVLKGLDRQLGARLQAAIKSD